MIIVHYTKSCSYNGTDKTIQLMCKYLPYCYYLYDRNNKIYDALVNLPQVERELGVRCIGFDGYPELNQSNVPYDSERSNLHLILEKLQPDIIHIHRSGFCEGPDFKSILPYVKIVETNIFGSCDPSSYVDYRLYVSECVRMWGEKNGNRVTDCEVLYNPCDRPLTLLSKIKAREKILTRFGFPSNTILLGHVGRNDPHIFDELLPSILSQLFENHSNVVLVKVNPCQNWLDVQSRLNTRKHQLCFLPCIVSRQEMSDFLQSLDIYVHCRRDGESCGCNLQEAMMHGIPVVTHETHHFNAQCEYVPDVVIAKVEDSESYYKILKRYIDDIPFRERMGQVCRRIAEEKFDAKKICEQLNVVYQNLL